MNEIALFGGGCFWCTEAVFRQLRGVSNVTSGYAGGHTPNPDYDHVSMGNTGHAEVIKIEFDPSEISYNQLLEVFFAVHDASQLNRQGADVGTQYRSIILTTSPEQSDLATMAIAAMRASGAEVTTEVAPLQEFFTAEQYHTRYYDRNPTQPYCLFNIVPKLDKVREKFPHLIRKKG